MYSEDGVLSSYVTILLLILQNRSFLFVGIQYSKDGRKMNINFRALFVDGIIHMGIDGLLPLVSAATRDAHISELQGKTVAVDAMCWYVLY